MENLELLGVQELNAVEMKDADGGIMFIGGPSLGIGGEILKTLAGWYIDALTGAYIMGYEKGKEDANK